MKIKISNVRVSFFDGVEPGEFTDKKTGKTSASYGTKGLFSKDDGEMYAYLGGIIKKVGTAEWQDKAGAILKNLKATDKLFLHDGDLQIDDEGEVKNGYEGAWFISCSQRDLTKPPKIYNKDGVLITPANQGTLEGVPYSGCYCDLLVEVWAQDNPTWGKRINARFLAAVFKADGEPFGAGALSDDDAREALGISAPDPLAAETADEPTGDDDLDDLFADAS